jgi:hypothetical protein
MSGKEDWLCGDWIETYTGRKVYPLNPKPEDFCIEDIAHSLSMLCRFNGHCKSYYSVAQHSVFVSRNLPRELALPGLLHDAAEAYIGDFPRPLKKNICWGDLDISDVEDSILMQIFKVFRVECPGPSGWEAIKEVDNRMLATEARDLMSHPGDWEGLQGIEPYPERIDPWPHYIAESVFLGEFLSLGGGKE